MAEALDREQRTEWTRKAFRLLDEWSVPQELHPGLLGLDPDLRKRFVNRYRLGMALPEDRDCYERIELMLRIDNALHKLFPHSRLAANLWITTNNPRYGGGTPLDTLLKTGLEGFRRVEESLASTGGW